MTYLAVAAIAVFTVHTVANAFAYPPTRRRPVPPADIEYWPGYLHELEGGL